jgi:CheY-like chemotaxis protein
MAPRILVVDDEPMVRALIVRVLSDAGYEVVAVANGQAALDAARAAEIEDFPSLPILHIDDISRKRLDQGLPDDVPTVCTSRSASPP